MNGIKDTRQEVNIASSVQEDLRVAKDPVHGKVNVGLLFKRTIPRGAVLVCILPRLAGDALDRLHGNITFFTNSQHLVEIFGIARILHHDVAIWKQHRIKVKLGK